MSEALISVNIQEGGVSSWDEHTEQLTEFIQRGWEIRQTMDQIFAEKESRPLKFTIGRETYSLTRDGLFLNQAGQTVWSLDVRTFFEPGELEALQLLIEQGTL